jgi:tetratricopeptide (TPR) repeat protein
MKRLIPLLLFCFAPLQAQPSPEALIRDGHFKRARAILEQRYQANPNDPETLRLLSKIRQAWGDTAMAVTLAEKALAANPKDARYHLQLADALGDRRPASSVNLGLPAGSRARWTPRWRSIRTTPKRFPCRWATTTRRPEL